MRSALLLYKQKNKAILNVCFWISSVGTLCASLQAKTIAILSVCVWRSSVATLRVSLEKKRSWVFVFGEALLRPSVHLYKQKNTALSRQFYFTLFAWIKVRGSFFCVMYSCIICNLLELRNKFTICLRGLKTTIFELKT